MPFKSAITTYQPFFVIVFAYILDLFLGDPRWLPHPVRWIGRFITFLENQIRRILNNPPIAPLYQRGGGGILEKVGGIFLFAIVVGTVFGFTWLFLYFTYSLLPIAHSLLSVFLAYTTLSIKSLHEEAYSVINALTPNCSVGTDLKSVPRGEGGVDEARKRLSNIVGRDSQNLSEEEIFRATVETVAENTSDGIIAPLFYLAIGGPVLALAYKAVNTLDSMVGYKNGKYKNFGWFSARMDDIANFIPARITAILMIIASFILRFNWKNSLKIVWRDSRNHPSPNAGYPEAAVAGALGLQLGGVNYYFGVPHNRSLIGDRENELTIESVKNTVKIMHLSAFLGVVLFAGIWIIVSLYIC